METSLEALRRTVGYATSTSLLRFGGIISEVAPTYFRVRGLSHVMTLGDIVGVEEGGRTHLAEAVRIEEDALTLKPFDHTLTLKIGQPVWRIGALSLKPDPSWKGRVLNSLGHPLDEKGPLLLGKSERSYLSIPPSALKRARVNRVIRTGVLVVDLFTPLCAGQRLGIFAGSGVGKSTLLSMLAQGNGFETVVVALVGERGREVREFIEDALAHSLEKCICVVATGDESPMMRRLAPQAALAIAEYFRDLGEDVLLIVDSVTRYAHACRDVALASGEAPVARGYAPSVFSELPKLLERAGPGVEGAGSITGIFSVLVDGDDHNDPVADNIRGTLDGHIVLDRAIAEQGRYPAVNILASLSRLAVKAWTPEQQVLITKIRALIARYEETKDLRMMGGYQQGSDPELDMAVLMAPQIYDLLKQSPTAALYTGDPFEEMARALSGKMQG